MSTYLYLVCLDHTPYLQADSESEQHLGDERLAKVRRWVADRESLVATSESEWGWRTDDYFLGNTLPFLRSHLKCRLSAKTEYGDWIDVGQGIPDDLNVKELSHCTQCGSQWKWRACGPTHAMIAAELGVACTEHDWSILRSVNPSKRCRYCGTEASS